MPSKLRSKLKPAEFYCVGCQKRVSAKKNSIELEKDRRDRARLVATCGHCKGCTVYKYVKESSVPSLIKKYG